MLKANCHNKNTSSNNNSCTCFGSLGHETTYRIGPIFSHAVKEAKASRTIFVGSTVIANNNTVSFAYASKPLKLVHINESCEQQSCEFYMCK
jgi:hypothetical protein